MTENWLVILANVEGKISETETAVTDGFPGLKDPT